MLKHATFVLSSSLSLSSPISSSTTSSSQLNLVPYPSEVTLGSSFLSLNPSSFHFEISSCSSNCQLLEEAIQRYSLLLFPSVGITGTIYRQSIFEQRINAEKPTGQSIQLLKLKIQSLETVKLSNFLTLFFYFFSFPLPFHPPFFHLDSHYFRAWCG